MDHYKILGVTVYNSIDEIKSAYRKLAKEYHPDINKNAGASEKFRQITEAYDYLLQNHIQKKETDLSKYEKIFRVITSDRISIAQQIIDSSDVMVYCLHGGSEFRFIIPKGTTLPVRVTLPFVKIPELYVYNDKNFW